MKRAGFIILIVVFASLLFADGTPAEGSGTENDPYLIETLDNLLWLSTTEDVWVANTNFLQTADIDASDTESWNDGAGFSPIGYDYNQPFSGIYNGEDNIIDGLFINREETTNIGLFGMISGALIESLNLTNVNITGADYTGGVVGCSYNSLLINCSSSGFVYGSNYTGGLVGQCEFDAGIQESSADCDVTGNVSTGGLVGALLFSSSVDLSYANGVVNGVQRIGGLAGYTHEFSSIINCFAIVEVNCSNMHAGGFIGYNQESIISNCYSQGTVSGECDFAGGFAGYNNLDATITGCYSCGQVDVNGDYMGGILGGNCGASISNSVWNHETSGQILAVGNNSSGEVTNVISGSDMEMHSMDIYTSIGWDFEDETTNGTDEIWRINNVMNEGYPFLSVMFEEIYNGESVAQFRVIPPIGNTPLAVSFIDESIEGNGIISWEWDFENDGIIDSYETDPEFTYYIAGTYDVSLTVTDINGISDTKLRRDYITVYTSGYMAEGSGSETDPFLISSLSNLLWLSESPDFWNSEYYFEQTCDIDASDTENWNNGTGFSPIGNEIDGPFYGNYDGNDHVIDCLYINRQFAYEIGFFGSTSGSCIASLGLTNVDITGYFYIGSLVGDNENSTIRGCYATGSVSGVTLVGGLVGENLNSSIDECYMSGSVSGNNRVGGLVGTNWNSLINESYAAGSLTGNGLVGGLVGENLNESTINLCFASVNVTGNGKIGGLLGSNKPGCSINGSFYNYETVLINNQHIISLGALSNEMYNAWISNNMSLEITDYLLCDGENYLITVFGDLEKLLYFGQNTEFSYQLTSDIDLSNNPDFFIPYFAGTFDGDHHSISGLNINRPDIENIGLFGYAMGAVIEDLFVAEVEVTGDNYTGGLSGNFISSTINSCNVTGNVSGVEYVGCLVGNNFRNSCISKSYTSGSVNGNSNAGGLTGGNNQESMISESYATCIISGGCLTGGLTGSNIDASLIINCYAGGSVTGGWMAGGLAGSNESSMIRNSYATVQVTGWMDVGGFVGHNTSTEIENCIWNIETSGQETGIGDGNGGINLLGLTTAEMHLMNSYTAIGWDFVGESVNGEEDIWDINNNLNDGYPYISDLGWTVGELCADFNADPAFGYFPLTINFTDTSVSQSSTITSWEWDFQNDGVIDSYEQNPVWVYNEQGFHSVSLTVIDDVTRAISTRVKENFIFAFYESIQPEGSGIEAEPYIIETLNNLIWISNNESCWSSHFIQIENIDANETQNWNCGTVFNPVGNFTFPFQGYYNGDNHYIDGLCIDKPDSNYVALFGITDGAVIQSLGLLNIYVNGNENAGSLVGYSCNGSSISESYATGNVNGYLNVGGLAGYCEGSNISECYFTGNTTGELYVGGLVGGNMSSSLSFNYAIGCVNGNETTGGLVGGNRFCTLYENYASCIVGGNYETGGMAGNSFTTDISNCIWNLEISGQIDGIGNYDNGQITNLLGKTTAEMQMTSTYTDIGWDFVGETTNGTEDIWDIDDGINDGYPFIYDIEYPVSNEENVIENVELNTFNYPNPFNPETTIYFCTTNLRQGYGTAGRSTKDAEINIYNVKGQCVRRLRIKDEGLRIKSVIWDGKDARGHSCASGVYFYSVKEDEDIVTGKMLMLK